MYVYTKCGVQYAKDTNKMALGNVNVLLEECFNISFVSFARKMLGKLKVSKCGVHNLHMRVLNATIPIAPCITTPNQPTRLQLDGIVSSEPFYRINSINVR